MGQRGVRFIRAHPKPDWGLIAHLWRSRKKETPGAHLPPIPGLFSTFPSPNFSSFATKACISRVYYMVTLFGLVNNGVKNAVSIVLLLSSPNVIQALLPVSLTEHKAARTI